MWVEISTVYTYLQYLLFDKCYLRFVTKCILCDTCYLILSTSILLPETCCFILVTLYLFPHSYIPIHAFWWMLLDTCNQILVTLHCTTYLIFVTLHLFVRVQTPLSILYVKRNIKLQITCFYLEPTTWQMLP